MSPTGKATFEFEFQVTGKPDVIHGKGAPGIGRLLINGKTSAKPRIPLTVPVMFRLTGSHLTCGYGNGEPVSPDGCETSIYGSQENNGSGS